MKRVLLRLATGLLRSLLAAALVVVTCATLLGLFWLLTDPDLTPADVAHAWVGLTALGLLAALPTALLYGLVVAPLAQLVRRLHPFAPWLLGALGGAGLTALLLTPRISWLGAMGGLVACWLDLRERPRLSQQAV